MIKRVIVSMLKVYKIFVSPVLLQLFGHGCKYEVTCSKYCIEQIENHGVNKGLILSARRLASCHPFGKTNSGIYT